MRRTRRYGNGTHGDGNCWNSILFDASQFAGGRDAMARIVDGEGNPVEGIGYQARKPADFEKKHSK
jgi:hypothetical protein